MMSIGSRLQQLPTKELRSKIKGKPYFIFMLSYPLLMKLGRVHWSQQTVKRAVDELFSPKLRQFSSHLNETWWNTWSLWRVDMHDILFVRPNQMVPELCPFFKILIYPYFLWQSLNREYTHHSNMSGVCVYIDCEQKYRC